MFISSWRRRPRTLWLIGVGALVGLDQLSNAYCASTIAPGGAVQVASWFNLADVYIVCAVFIWALLSFMPTTHLAAGTSPAKAKP